MPFCPACGNASSDDARFCMKCGRELGALPIPAQPPAEGQEPPERQEPPVSGQAPPPPGSRPPADRTAHVRRAALRAPGVRAARLRPARLRATSVRPDRVRPRAAGALAHRPVPAPHRLRRLDRTAQGGPVAHRGAAGVRRGDGDAVQPADRRGRPRLRRPAARLPRHGPHGRRRHLRRQGHTG
ncbi:zinc ribbon domain-containing protein [Streptomyces sp. So13.3]|nr:zinc ribbon domain-containing protein [Streptomyces sp. So13.3]